MIELPKNSYHKNIHKSIKKSSDNLEFIVKMGPTETYKDPVKHSTDSLVSETKGLALGRNMFTFKSFREELQRLLEGGIL